MRGLESAGVIATLKHFAGYSASRAGRNLAPVSIGPREVADVLLPPFEAALRAGARSVMNSYADLDGVPVAADPQLLTELLRDRYGFTGTVVADYFAVKFLHTLHGVAADPGEAAGLALAAGIDVELPTVDCYGEPLLAAVEAGRVDAALVDRALERVLLQKCKLGLLDAGWSPEAAEAEDEAIELDGAASRALAGRLARRSIVLLDNDGTLPLRPGLRLAVVGPRADAADAMMGCYAFPVHVGSQHPDVPMGIEVATVLDALRADPAGYVVTHAQGCPVLGGDDDGLAAAAQTARSADVCIVVLGDQAGLFGRGTSGEGCDAPDLRLPGRQEELLEAVLTTGTPAVLVLLVGRPYELSRQAARLAAIVCGFYAGEEGGPALADVLSERAAAGPLPGGRGEPALDLPRPGARAASRGQQRRPDRAVPVRARLAYTPATEGGLHCNVDLVSHQGTSGGFKVLRYIDPAGHECALYDTALLFPVNALKLDTTSAGVAVLDMSDPARPVQTATLTELPMMSPHESLNLSPARGLLAAVLGNPSTYPGLVSIYDVRQDCRHPVLQSTRPVTRIGHESGFSPDGRTFYAAGTAMKAITAVDVTDPKQPHAIWQGNVLSHGLTLSPDGKRAYIADPDGEMLILDVSQIQARKASPQAREVSRLSWKSASIPQNALPFTDHGKPYVLEFDEYTQGTTGAGDTNAVGAGRIIDIADERAPRVVANLRLQVNQPADHAAASSDPGAGSPVQGYAAHYCSLSSEVDPTVVACSFITSGLRVFDISDLLHPKEIAYYVAPTQPRAENEFMASDFAMSKPTIVPARREVWYTDGATGFNVLRVSPDAWPAATAGAGGGSGAATPACLSRSAPMGRRGIGRVRLGMTRTALARRLPAPQRRTKHSWRWCVKGGKGNVSVAFAKSGRVAIVATTAARKGKLSPGSSAARLRRRYPHHTSVGRAALVRATARSTRVFGVSGGRVRHITVAAPRTIARRKLLRGYLRAAGLRPR